MPLTPKHALEMRLRDALDGMEQLTSMLSYGRLPDDLEVIGIGPDSDFTLSAGTTPAHIEPSIPLLAEVIDLSQFRRTAKPIEHKSAHSVREKNNKIIML